MRNQKKTKFFSLGRKWVFTLALFLFVFAAASIVKVKAGTEHSASGWIWGGGAQVGSYPPADGTNTNVGWISVNNTNQGGAVDYGVSIPSGTGDLSGYAWSENIGWISFNAADLSGCPQGTCNAMRDGINIKGWARIMSIPQAGANAGGWQGWISLSGSGYGLKIDTVNNKFQNGSYAWSDELGWVDFSSVNIVSAPSCSTKAVCVGGKIGATGSSCDPVSFCSGDAGAICTITSDTQWSCKNTVGIVISCPATITSPDDGECGTAVKMNFCGKDAPSANLCAKGSASSVSAGYSEYTWTCGSAACGGHQVSCSAPGNHCGWIETNP